MTDKCVATNHEESQPLAPPAEQSEQPEPEKTTIDKAGTPDKKAADAPEEDDNKPIVIATVTLAPSPVRPDVVDVDLSSENHPSRSSSPDNCIENDDHMLMASV